jgi:DNA-binding winged helix-turn-helix (wHTH) protein/CheY-like chemotaxis protein
MSFSAFYIERAIALKRSQIKRMIRPAMPASSINVSSLPNVFRLGPWRVLRDQNRLERQNGETAQVERIEPKAMDVLCLLAANAGQTVTREALLEKVWAGRMVVEAALSRIILSLRNSLGDDARSPTFIETVPKRGYRLLVQPGLDEAGVPAQIAERLPTNFIDVHSVVAARRRTWVWVAAFAGTVVISAWLAWPRIQLERATSSGIGAMESRGEAPTDRDVLREDLRQIRSGRVLWVDDQPTGNRREITTLEQAGLVVDTAISNAAAADQMRGREYDLIISDIRRPSPENENSGLDLPRVVVPDRNRLPPIIYYLQRVTGPRTQDGYPVTNKPSELFHMVSDVFRWRETSPQIRKLDRPVAPSTPDKGQGSPETS